MNKVTEKLWYIYILLNATDIFTTEAALELGAREGNPLANWILGEFGALGLYGLKALFIGMYAFLYGYQVKTGKERHVQLALIAGSFLMGIVTLWNLGVLLKEVW